MWSFSGADSRWRVDCLDTCIITYSEDSGRRVDCLDTCIITAHEGSKGFAQKVTLLEDELAVEHQAWEVSKREHQVRFKELTHLQTWGSELCHSNIGPPWVRHYQSEEMRIATLHHTKMAGELAALRAVVTTTTESVLGRSPNDTFRTAVVSELSTEY
jgi:hypothetical protein